MNEAIEAAIEIINAGIRNIKNMHENYPTKGAMAGAFTVIKIALRQNAGAVDVEALKLEMVQMRFGHHPKLAEKGAMEWAVDYLVQRGLIKGQEGKS